MDDDGFIVAAKLTKSSEDDPSTVPCVLVCSNRSTLRSDVSQPMGVWSKYSNAQRVSILHLPKGGLNPPSRSDTYSSSPEGVAMDWKTMLAYITGAVDEELLLRNEYLVVENRVLRHALKEYVVHHHHERNHQGKERSRERLGGLLRFYHREAA